MGVQSRQGGVLMQAKTSGIAHSCFAFITVFVSSSYGAESLLPSTPPMAKIGFTTTASAQVENRTNNAEISAHELDASANFASHEFSSVKLVFGAHYKFTRYNLDNLNADKDLYVIEVPIRFIRQFGKWNVITNVTPGIHSDFEEIDDDDFTVTGLLRASYQQSDETSWVVGVGVDRSFGDSQAYPVVGIRYAPDEHWRFDLIFPRLSINYALSSRTFFFWNVLPAGDKWDVEVDAIDKEFNVTTKAIRISIGAEINLSEHAWLRIEAGREVNRSIELVNDNGAAFDLSFEDVNFAGINILYRR